MVARTTIGILIFAVAGVSVHSVWRKAGPTPVIDLGSTSRANSFPKGQCTWYAFERALDAGNRIRFSRSYGRDAKKWPTLAIGSQLSQTPTPGSVMVLDAWDGNPYGHVAYVESVQGSTKWTVSHANMKVGEEFASMDGVKIRKSGCAKQADGTITLEGFKARFHLLGFLLS